MCSYTVPEDQPQDRLDHTTAYIKAHYRDQLNLEKLAAITHISKFHFHRLFKKRFGETIHNYIKRVRLENAAYRLATDAGASISEVADACGFSSSQNFARAFTAQFGFPPSSVRKNPIRILTGKMKSSKTRNRDKTPLNVEVKEFAPCRVAYLRDICAYRSESNDRAIERLFQWAVAAGHVDARTRLMGVCWSDFETTSPHECVFDACLNVPKNVKGNGEVRIQTLPGGKLAVLHFEDVWEHIPAQRDRLFAEWLPVSCYKRDERPFFFVYYNNPHMNRRKLAIVDMCLPIKP